MITEGLIRGKLTPEKIAKAILDVEIIPTLVKSVGEEEYKIEYIDEKGREAILYSGRDSDIAYNTWVNLDEKGIKRYYRNGKIHSEVKI
jgi:hypothetical protein